MCPRLPTRSQRDDRTFSGMQQYGLGTSTPSPLAALRLMTSSYFVGTAGNETALFSEQRHGLVRQYAPRDRDRDERCLGAQVGARGDRKSTRLNSSHTVISYAVFCLKKKK